MFKFKSKSKKTQDFTEGPLFPPFFRFGLAILVSNLAQGLYNTADRMVIGKFSGDNNALAAIAATGVLTTMLIQTVMALTVGTTITLAKAHGRKDSEEVSTFLHTSIAFALIAGIAFGVIGQFASMPLLRWLGTKPELIDNAHAYISIIFLGLPFSSVSSFAGVSLCARGRGAENSAIVVSSGVINVLLNVLFVAAFKMSVRGVAIATIISQAFSAVALLIILYRDEESIAFRFRKLKLDIRKFLEIFKIGAPNSLNAVISSLAGMVTVSAFNSLPLDILRADAAADGLIAIFQHVTWSFTVSAVAVAVAQNYGAKKYKRIKLTMRYAALCLFGSILLLSPIYIIFPKTFLSLFADRALENFEATITLAVPILILYCFCNTVNSFSVICTSSARALGHPFSPLVISLVTTAFNVVWCVTIYPKYQTPISYYLHRPLCVMLGLAINLIAMAVYLKNIKKKFEISDV